MKKAISILICIFITISGIFAGPYMMSYAGSYAIPMDSPAYPILSSDPIWLNTTRAETGDRTNPDGSAVPHNKYIEYMLDINKRKNVEGNYSDFSMISIGGYKDVDLNDTVNGSVYNSVMMRITVESPAGLNFISLSHPNITRPYGVAAVPVIQYKNKGNSFPPDDTKVAVFKNSGDTFDFIFKNIQNLNGGNILQEVWYDMILILPGDWDGKSSTLADTKNRITIAGASYELVPVDDYSSVVNIRIELFGGHDGAGFVPIEAPQMLSIPISGYYVEGAAQRDDKNATFGMHIMPNNNCANLNINQQQGKLVKIADINLLSKNIETSGPNLFPNEPLYNGKVPEKPTGQEPIPAPKTPLTNVTCTMRPEPSYSGYYHTDYFFDRDKYAWPRYDCKDSLSWYDTVILPGGRKPQRSDYGRYADEKYTKDLNIWTGMNDPQNYSPEYKSFLATQKAWDDRENDPRQKAWVEQTKAYQAHQQWEKDIVAWPNKSKNDMFVFFSSNQDPMALNPEPFMLVHENKPGDTPLNSRNHIKFTLVAYDKQDKSTKSFDGTTYFDPMGDSSQFEKFIQTHDFSLSGDAFHGSAQNNRKYEGEIYLVMENKPDQIMIRGKYTEKIFVHVISSR